MTIRTRLTVAGSGVALIGVLAACGASGGGASTSATDAASTTASSATTSAVAPTGRSNATTAITTTTSSGGTTGAAAGTGNAVVSSAGSSGGSSRCAESQLRASVDPRHIPGNGTPDNQGRTRKAVLIDFRNTSSSTCTLYGYPGAATETEDNKQLQQARRTLQGSLIPAPSGQSAPTTVTLKPGASAAAFIEGVDRKEQGAAQAGCDGTTPKIVVTPPNTRTPVPFRVAWGLCFSLEVHPVRALPAS